MDCQALVVDTKVVIQPVCGHSPHRYMSSCWTLTTYPLWCCVWRTARLLSGLFTDACKCCQQCSNIVDDLRRRSTMTGITTVHTVDRVFTTCVDSVSSNVKLLNKWSIFGPYCILSQIFRAVLYCIHHFPARTYRAITNHKFWNYKWLHYFFPFLNNNGMTLRLQQLGVTLHCPLPIKNLPTPSCNVAFR